MSETPNSEKKRSYTYKRFMRDGSVKEVTAVVRSRSKPKVGKKEKVSYD